MAPLCEAGARMRYWSDSDWRSGNTIDASEPVTLETCMDHCLDSVQCKAFAYDHNSQNCWRKPDAPLAIFDTQGYTGGLACSFRTPNEPPKEPSGQYIPGGKITAQRIYNVLRKTYFLNYLEVCVLRVILRYEILAQCISL